MTTVLGVLAALASLASAAPAREPKEISRTKWRITPPEGFVDVKKDRGWEWTREAEGRLSEQITAFGFSAKLSEDGRYEPKCWNGNRIGPATEGSLRGMRTQSYLCLEEGSNFQKMVVEYKNLWLTEKYMYTGETRAIQVIYRVWGIGPEEWKAMPERERERKRPSRKEFLDVFASLEPMGWAVPASAAGEPNPGKLDDKKPLLLR